MLFASQVEIACRCGRHLAAVGMDRSPGPITADRYGLVTVRRRNSGRGVSGDVVDEGERLLTRCPNPRCRLARVVRHDTVMRAADRAYQVGRSRIMLGEDL